MVSICYRWAPSLSFVFISTRPMLVACHASPGASVTLTFSAQAPKWWFSSAGDTDFRVLCFLHAQKMPEFRHRRCHMTMLSPWPQNCVRTGSERRVQFGGLQIGACMGFLTVDAWRLAIIRHRGRVQRSYVSLGFKERG